MFNILITIGTFLIGNLVGYGRLNISYVYAYYKYGHCPRHYAVIDIDALTTSMWTEREREREREKRESNIWIYIYNSVMHSDLNLARLYRSLLALSGKRLIY